MFQTTLPVQLAYSHEQRFECTQSDLSIGKSATVNANRSPSATQMTRVHVFAQALPSQPDETRHARNSGTQMANAYVQMDDDRPRKRQRLTELEDANDAHVSPSPAAVIKMEEDVSHPLCALPISESSVTSKVTPKIQQPKKTRPNQRTNNREKLLWSDEETADLIRGVNLVGYGRWRLVLNHPDLKFLKERTSVDLKDRSVPLQSSLLFRQTNAKSSYRTCLNNGWATNTIKMPKAPRVRRKKSDTSPELLISPLTNSPLKIEAHDDATGLHDSAQYCSTTTLPSPHAVGMQSPSRVVSVNESKSSIQIRGRKQKQPWTHEEDSLLWAGYKKHGFKWLAIAKDDSLGLSHRRCTAIRDRFRLRLPSLYMDNVKIEKSAQEGGKTKMHWSLRKLVGRDQSGPDPVLLALSEEGLGDEEGEAAFTDQEDEDEEAEDGEAEDGDDENDSNVDDGDEDRGGEIKLEATESTNSTGMVFNEEMQHLNGPDYGPDALEFDFSASEPLIQRFFNDEDFDLGYDEEADEDYFDDGMLENKSLPAFTLPSEFAENLPDFSELWNDNDEEGRDEDSDLGSEDDEEQGEHYGFEEFLEVGDRHSENGYDNGHYDSQVQKAGINSPIAAAPLLWEEMATQPMFDLEDDN